MHGAGWHIKYSQRHTDGRSIPQTHASSYNLGDRSKINLSIDNLIYQFDIPAQVLVGQALELNWNVPGAKHCRIEGDDRLLDESGSTSIVFYSAGEQQLVWECVDNTDKPLVTESRLVEVVPLQAPVLQKQQ
ncbi:hypothetical protein P2G88_01120 [Aliiglaciecola sp. CAU 1673]|uniref:hypothetical protein n=1 Tax=Aliiglaciecola sp. CAU 1673 TaxID=3032595 RepID=UPI0023DAF755|nr:hypothetical protein [Aliiglaciecola sp. CAU 1673]MDF2176851.1 hypothetical protein [Aliiglaciecola sp. CAU 1673]